MKTTGAGRPRPMVTRSQLGLATLVAALCVALVGGCRSEPTAAPGRTEDGSAAPSTPAVATVPADYLERAGTARLSYMRLKPQRVHPGQGVPLRGPHFNYLLAATAVTRKLTANQATALGLAKVTEAAPGHELVIAEASAAGELDEGNGGVDGSLSKMEMVVGDRVRPAPVASADDLRGLLVISVPVGVHPVLRVTDAGRVQSLDLVSGRRGRDAIAGYYPVRTGAGDSDQPEIWVRLSGPGAAGLTGDDRLAAININDVDATLQPYLPGRGWARQQRTWLVLEPNVTYFRPSGATEAEDRVQIDPASFGVTGPDDTRYPVSGRPINAGKLITPAGTPLGQAGSAPLVADVPAAVRTVVLTFALRASIRLPKGPVSWSRYQGGTQTVRLTLS